MNRILLSLSVSFCLAGFGANAFAQATVEGAMGAAAAATGSAPARNVGKSMSGLADKLAGALKGAPGGSGTQADTRRQTARTTSTLGTTLPAPKPAAKLEDPAGIQAGMTDDEVLRRFGPPNLRVTEDSGISSLLYSQKTGNIRVRIQDGKVASVEKPKS